MNKLIHFKLFRYLTLAFVSIMIMGLQLPSVYGQTQIRGKVTDERSNGLAGTSVAVKGTSTGTITDQNGEYSLSVDDTDAVLVFTFVGYTTREVAVGDQTEINVQMSPDVRSLDQVVVVGYGTQRKREITGSIGIADTEIMSKSESNNISNRLQGLVPGVTVTGNGEPGSLGQIRIRGNVFTGVDGGGGANQPLFVIDGVLTNDSRFLNPNDIESVQVLKDASSSAIYGSRAANGVIIVTTKKGKPGKPQINFSSSFGIQQIPNQIELANTEQWARINRAIYDGAQPDLYADNSETGLYDPNRYTNWQEEMTRNANIRDLNLSISGGTEKSNIYFSFNNTRQEGTVGDPLFERYNARINSEIKLGERLTIGESLAVGKSILSQPEGGLEAIYEMLPVIPLYDESNPSGYGYGDDTYARTYASNPLALQEYIFNQTTGQHLLGNAFLRWEIIDGLEYEFNASYDLEMLHGKSYNEAGQIAWVNILPSGLSETDDEFYSYFIENKIQFKKTYGKHSFSAMASYVGQKEHSRTHGTSITGGYTFEGKNFWEIDASTAPLSNYSHSGNESTYAIESYLGRVTYDYGEKYLLNFMMRHDGSSRFLKDVRWGNFPSISGGWILSNEDFLTSVSQINFLKLRAGYGLVGNATGADYVYQSELILRAIGGVNYNLGPEGRSVLGAARGRLANAFIQWEKLQELDIGFDLRMFNSKLEVIFDYFNGRTYDLIYSRPLPLSVGAEQSSIIENNAGIKRNGIELSAHFKNSSDVFSFDIGGNISYIKTTLNELANDLFISDTEEANFVKTRSFIGGNLGQYYLLEMDGIYTQEQIDALPDGFTIFNQTPVVGDAKFIDHGSDPNGDFAGAPDGMINEYDRIPYGNINPFRYGISFNASYKSIDFTLFLQGVTKWDVYNSWYEQLITNDFSNYPADYDPYYEGEGTDPRAVFGFSHFSKIPSTRYIENGAYLRLKNLQIGYNIPLKKVNRFRIYLSGQNLLTFTKYRGLDPEIEGSMFDPGVDQQNFPNLRTYSAGVNISF